MGWNKVEDGNPLKSGRYFVMVKFTYAVKVKGEWVTDYVPFCRHFVPDAGWECLASDEKVLYWMDIPSLDVWVDTQSLDM